MGWKFYRRFRTESPDGQWELFFHCRDNISTESALGMSTALEKSVPNCEIYPIRARELPDRVLSLFSHFGAVAV